MHKFLRIASIVLLISSLFQFAPLTSAQTNPNAIVQDAVRFYFADAPVMIDIAKCETGYRQYNADGSTLFDASGTYIGVFQVSYLLHKPKAESMGYDLTTLDGNLQYARYLYTTSGTGPWKGCLPASAVPVTPVATTPLTDIITPTPAPISGAVTVNLRMGVTNPQVLTVQQLLNRNGFVVAASGVGSPGNETSYFGMLTREAVRKFQCAKINVCTGDEATTGFGRVGPATRAALNQL